MFLDIYGDRTEETRQLNEQANQVLNSPNKGSGLDLLATRGQDTNFEGEEFQNQLQRIYADNAKPEEKAKNYKRTRRPDLVLGEGDVIGEISSGKKHVTAVKWPSKLNQIFVGWGNDISILFEAGKSKKGIMPALRKVKTKKKIGKCTSDIDHSGILIDLLEKINFYITAVTKIEHTYKPIKFLFICIINFIKKSSRILSKYTTSHLAK